MHGFLSRPFFFGKKNINIYINVNFSLNKLPSVFVTEMKLFSGLNEVQDMKAKKYKTIHTKYTESTIFSNFLNTSYKIIAGKKKYFVY